MNTAYDYPSAEGFDYSDCILVRAMEESPEFSSHDFSKIGELTWYTHGVNLRKLNDKENVSVKNHKQLDQPVRFFDHEVEDTVLADVGSAAAESHTVEVPESGIISPYLKMGRNEPMSDELFELCLENIAQGLNEMSGVYTPDGFLGRIRQKTQMMMSEPEWQHRPDEVFCRVVEEFARVQDSDKMESYRSPYDREPEWVTEDEPGRPTDAEIRAREQYGPNNADYATYIRETL